MTNIELPKYVTFKSYNNRFLTVSSGSRGDLVFIDTDGNDPRSVFEVVPIPGSFQTAAFKSYATGKFWKRSMEQPWNWIYASADDLVAADSFQYQTQDATNTLLAFWSPPDAMFLRQLTAAGRNNNLCAFSRGVDEGGADQFTRFTVAEASVQEA